MVGGVGDETRFVGVAQESTFEKDCGVADSGEDAEAGASDTAVGTDGAFHDGAVNCGGEGDVFRVPIVAGFGGKVGVLGSAAVVGEADGGEGEGFDAVGAAATTGVEVETDEDGVSVAIRDFDTLGEGGEFVGLAGEDDVESAFFELGLEEFGDLEGEVFFMADAADGTGVLASVTWIDDDGGEGRCGADVFGAEDRIDQLGQIDAGDEVAAALDDDGVAEDELDVIHPEVLTTDGEAHFDGLVFEDNLVSTPNHAIEFVEGLDATNSDIFVSVVGNLLPSGRGRRQGSGGNQGGEDGEEDLFSGRSERHSEGMWCKA